MKLSKALQSLLKEHCAFLSEMRHMVSSLVPDDFSWRLELGKGMQCTVSYWARGVRSGHVGRISDADYAVCMYLLESVSWYEERRLAGCDTLRRDEGQPSPPLGVRPDGAAAVGVVRSVEARERPRREGRWF